MLIVGRHLKRVINVEIVDLSLPNQKIFAQNVARGGS